MNQPGNHDFTLIDLVSQGSAVTELVRGWSTDQILDWLRLQGHVEALPEVLGRKAYSFCSATGITSQFFLDSNGFVLIGDNTLFRPK